MVVARGAEGGVAFLAQLNNSLSVPGTIMPTNLSTSSCDVYFNRGYGWNAAQGATGNCTECVPHVTAISYLPFDFPVAPLFNVEGLPAEPFVRNVSSKNDDGDAPKDCDVRQFGARM